MKTDDFQSVFNWRNVLSVNCERKKISIVQRNRFPSFSTEMMKYWYIEKRRIKNRFHRKECKKIHWKLMFYVLFGKTLYCNVLRFSDKKFMLLKNTTFAVGNKKKLFGERWFLPLFQKRNVIINLFNKVLIFVQRKGYTKVCYQFRNKLCHKNQTGILQSAIVSVIDTKHLKSLADPRMGCKKDWLFRFAH
jgi:hypothetical protein